MVKTGKTFPAALVVLFWDKVDRRDDASCWLWKASTIRGYGQFSLPRVNGRQPKIYAHRFSYELAHGVSLSPDLKVCHHCDTPLCVNPRHLFLGSQQDNLDDARRKGRLIDGIGARVLSLDAYREILLTEARGIDLAQKYGVTAQSISRIRNGSQGQALRAEVLAPSVERVPFRRLPVVGVLHLQQAFQSGNAASEQARGAVYGLRGSGDSGAVGRR